MQAASRVRIWPCDRSMPSHRERERAVGKRICRCFGRTGSAARPLSAKAHRLPGKGCLRDHESSEAYPLGTPITASVCIQCLAATQPERTQPQFQPRRSGRGLSRVSCGDHRLNRYAAHSAPGPNALWPSSRGAGGFPAASVGASRSVHRRGDRQSAPASCPRSPGSVGDTPSA